jgi:TPP-dependent pyruvate/acetoin dehydrogenase alpha subunit
MKSAVRTEVDCAVDFARRSPLPEAKALHEDLFA